MKNSAYTLLFGTLILMGCSNEPAEVDTVVSNEDSTVEMDLTNNSIPSETFEVPKNSAENVFENTNQLTSDKDYQEYHETGELKIEGNYDENQQRHGIWASYYETGIKWSESNYKNGIKNGHSITFYPTGKVRYLGEYANDKQIGHWTFYDEEGNVVKEEDY